MILPPPPRQITLEPVDPGELTEFALPAVLPGQQEEQGPTWQEIGNDEQNRLVHLLLYPDRTEEEPRNYVGDLNLLRLLIRWAKADWRAFKFEEFEDRILRRMINRLGMPAEYGNIITIGSGLSVLEATDVCYALLETYGQFRPDMAVPRYGDVWHKRIQ